MELTDQERARLVKYDSLVEKGIDPYGQKFEVSIHAKELKDTYAGFSHEELEEKKIKVSVAGRIMLLRKMGKASFFTIKDRTGMLQVYIQIDNVGEDNYSTFKLADTGDICGVEGYVMLTQTGELTVKATKYTHLVKSLKPLPEKYHGLADVEERYRKRYLDLIMNDEAMFRAVTRSKVVKAIRNYFDSKGFFEVETPILETVKGGASARPFITHHNALDMDLYMRIATEISLKKLLVGGMEKVYEIGRIFRNEGVDTKHNPEFTSMELYEAYANLDTMMFYAEDLIKSVAKEVIGKDQFTFLGQTIDLSKPFKKAKMTDLIKEKTGIDFEGNNYSLEEAKELAQQKGLKVEPHFTVGHIINLFFEEFCEEDLKEPTFLMYHPIEISPLTKENKQDPRFVERFELYISGVEFANAYTELNSLEEQKKRFEEELKAKALGDDEASELDETFLDALTYGMPPAGGIGIGIDRLLMLLTETDTIREVILFPHMKNK